MTGDPGRPGTRLVPVSGPIWVVRWVRLDGRDVRHRYFRRRGDAEALQRKFRAVGREARVYETTTKWREVGS